MMLTPNEDFSLPRINMWDLTKYTIVSDTLEVKVEVSEERNQCLSVRIDRVVLVSFLLE